MAIITRVLTGRLVSKESSIQRIGDTWIKLIESIAIKYNVVMNSTTLQMPIELNELQLILKEHGVVSASVFGSYARGEARTDSDLDLLVTLSPGRTYLDLGGLQYVLQQKFAGGVDITTKLNPHFEPYIKNELVKVM